MMRKGLMVIRSRILAAFFSGPSSPEYRPSHCRNELRILLRRDEWLDQAAIREYLEQSDPTEWKEILAMLLMTPFFRNR